MSQLKIPSHPLIQFNGVYGYTRNYKIDEHDLCWLLDIAKEVLEGDLLTATNGVRKAIEDSLNRVKVARELIDED